MYACDYLENGFLNALRGVSFPAPAKCYLALFLNDPGESGDLGTEISYSGYDRKEISFSEPAPINGGVGVQNTSDITFSTPPNAAGTVTHIGVMDSAVGGNMLARGELTESLVVGANEPPVFLAGDIQFYMTGSLSNAYKAKLLNLLRGLTLQGTTPYFSLWNGSPEAAGAELSGDNYARAAITFSAPEEQTSGQKLISNTVKVVFPRPSTLWGNWTHATIYSAQTAGEPVCIQALQEAIQLKKGYMPIIEAGALKVGLN